MVGKKAEKSRVIARENCGMAGSTASGDAFIRLEPNLSFALCFIYIAYRISGYKIDGIKSTQ